MQVFSRALNVSESELFKMMEQGQLVSSEVLPKVAAELKKAALEGGAFEKALKGLRVTEGQMITESQRAGNTIFKSGFSEGLSELYKTIGDILKDSGPQLEKLGAIFGKVFQGIAYGFKVLEPILKITIDNFELIFGALAISRINNMAKTMELFGSRSNKALLRAFLPITAALAAAEELIGLFSDKIVTNLERQSGKQFNLLEGTQSNLVEKDGKFYKDKASVRGLLASDPRDPLPKKKEDFLKMSTLDMAKGLQGGGIIDLIQMLAKPVNGSSGNVGSPFSALFKGSEKPSVIINNTYNNASADQMIRHQQLQSMTGMSATK